MSTPVTLKDGTIRYFNEKKQLHREDGPAIIWLSGDKEWFLNGKRHRQGAPAIEFAEVKVWYIDGKKHREDGAAVEYNEESLNQYFLRDKEVKASSLIEFLSIVRFKAFI